MPQSEIITQRSSPDLDRAKVILAPRIRRKRKLAQRDRFLAEFDSVTPCGKLHNMVGPFDPEVEGAGRQPIGLTRMLPSRLL